MNQLKKKSLETKARNRNFLGTSVWGMIFETNLSFSDFKNMSNNEKAECITAYKLYQEEKKEQFDRMQKDFKRNGGR